jgi:hypothetical protein
LYVVGVMIVSKSRRAARYPQLERYFDERLHEWCLENCVEEEDCGEVVRLRRGRFPRKVAAEGSGFPPARE